MSDKSESSKPSKTDKPASKPTQNQPTQTTSAQGKTAQNKGNQNQQATESARTGSHQRHSKSHHGGRKHADKRPSTQVTSQQQNSGKKTKVASIAMVIAIIALVFSLWQWWQVNNTLADANSTKATVNSNQTKLQDTLSKQQDAVQDALKKIDDKAETALTQSQHANKALEKLQEQNGDMDNKIADLQKLTGTGAAAISEMQNHLLTMQVQTLLQSGLARYQLAGDTRAASQAYHMAKKLLKQSDNKAFAEVAEAIDKDLNDLRNSPLANDITAARQMADIRMRIADLPLKATQQDANAAGATTNNVWQKTKSKLSSLVSVRDTSQSDRHKTARPSTHKLLMLDAAQIQTEYLNHDAKHAKAGINDLIEHINETFDTDDDATGKVLDTLQSLLDKTSDKATTPPDTALKMLKSLDINKHTSAAIGNYPLINHTEAEA